MTAVPFGACATADVAASSRSRQPDSILGMIRYC